MIIQIFGRKNCNDTKKVQRFFKERGIKFQFIDFSEKAPSKKEFENFLKYYNIEEFLDINGNEFKKRNLQYHVFDTKELLLENPILFKTPIIRWEKGVLLGYNLEILKKI
ncbi:MULTISPECIES: arsenate reductase family protein [Cetobacterium]|jgi:Spx/MgsR family transcriptional regulator|uniref:Arsenate reductase family protein n=1 Tax=Candidatus Cetobacterium colombiensis TaxID=3073100 RepID=A0ABU4W713_9FUSO|nr:arsenate reductase family protein [Candidatus Cetobacterium colombiensis]MDX8335325.1 arsenate reductase family protein [Candidatus Cetobacterium colombiensis]